MFSLTIHTICHCNGFAQGLCPGMLSRLLSTGSVAGRGGARRKSSPVVDADILATIFEKHKSIVANFGVYESTSRNQAVKGKGILHCRPLLWDLLEACPIGDMPAPSAKQAMAVLVLNDPSLNSTIYNTSIWSQLRCERVGTLLYHLRRLKREPARFKQCALTLTGEELGLLKSLMAKLQLEDDEHIAAGLSNFSAKADSGSLPEDDEGRSQADIDPVAETAQSPFKRRMLRKTPSTVSCDSDGFPKCLADDATDVEPVNKKVKVQHKIVKGSHNSDVDIPVDADGYPLLLLEGSSSSNGHAVVGKTQGKTKAKAKAKVKDTDEEKAKASDDQKKNNNIQTSPKSSYKLEKYYASNSVGIRLKGGSQIFAVRYVHKDGSYEDLCKIAVQVCEQLDSGMPVDDANQWAKDRL